MIISNDAEAKVKVPTSDSDDKLFCGVDTSNYTTSCAISDAEGNILINLKKPLPVAESSRGLRQSDAVFAHIKNLPELMEALKDFLGDRKITAVGVSSKPRDAEDSYMPCFLSGVVAAEALSAASNAPLYRFSHQQGHIRAAFETSGANETIGLEPFISFHVSGGTTEILLVNQHPDEMKVDLIGGTADLNAGQAVDRTGVMMGLKFPCGPEMERLALGFNGKLNKPKITVRGTECNLSGLENITQKMFKDGASKEEISAFVFDYIAHVLLKLTENARAEHGNLPVVFAGGVMSNSIIQNKLVKLGNVFFTKPEFSADNAAGIALLTRNRYLFNSEKKC